MLNNLYSGSTLQLSVGYIQARTSVAKVIFVVINNLPFLYKCFANLILCVLLLLCGNNAFAQQTLTRLEQLLLSANERNMDSTVNIIRRNIDSLPVDEALQNTDKLFRLSVKAPYRIRAFEQMNGLLQYLFNKKSNNRDYLLYALSILETDEQFKEPAIQHGLFYSVGCYYFSINDFANAEIYLKRFLDHPEYAWAGNTKNALTTLGMIAAGYKDYASAARYHEKALNLALKEKDSAWIGLSSGNLGINYLRLGRIAEAETLLRNDIDFSLRKKMFESAAGSFASLAGMAFNRGDDAKGKRLLDSSIYFLDHDDNDTRFTHARAETYTLLAGYYARHNRADTAYALQVKVTEIRDSLTKRRLMAHIRLKLNAFNQAKERQQQLLLKNTMAEKRRNEMLLSTILLIALVVIVFTVLLLRQKKRIASILEEKADSIHRRHEAEQRMNQTKSKLFSVVAHDLRGPLGSLKSLFELVDAGVLPKEVVYNEFPMLQQAIHNLYDTTDSLLNWSYSQLDGIEAKPQAIELTEIVQSVFAFLKTSATAKKIMLLFESSANSTAFADATQVEVVLRNLVNNAIKFTAEGGTVTVSLQQKNGFMEVAVADTGLGMSEKKLQTVFDDQPQSAQGTEGEKGMGLGLVICKDFIANNKGSIWVEHNHPQGCIFKFTLPLNVA